jgi:urease accessory protein
LLKALPSEDNRRLEAVLVHPPGGLVGGDSLQIDVALDAGARVLATTPGAQKWYGRSGQPASGRTRLVLADGAMLEWLPRPAIVYDGAHARQSLAVELSRESCFIGWEALVRGRMAMGERFASGRIEQTLAIAIDGEPIWEERLFADAADRLFASPLGWDGRLVAASVWCCAPSLTGARLAGLRDRWRRLIEPDQAAVEGAEGAAGTTAAKGPAVLVGGATIPTPGLVLAKLLADDSEILAARCRALWQEARHCIEGDGGSMPRIWRT